MKHWITLFLFTVIIASASAKDIVVDNFEGYADDAAIVEAWVYGSGGGPVGLTPALQTTSDDPAPYAGKQGLKATLDMPNKWMYNYVKKDIPGGPIKASDFLTVEFMFHGDSEASADMTFMLFLIDSNNNFLRFQLSSDFLLKAEWQKVSAAIDSFTQEQWDGGGDCDPNDIVKFAVVWNGNEDAQYGTFYVDDIKLTEKPTDLPIDTFEGYADDEALVADWSVVVSGEGSTLNYGLDKTTPPQGKNSLFLDLNMPLKWYNNMVTRTINPGPINLKTYSAVQFWLKGDDTLRADENGFYVMLFDSKNNGIRFQIPDANLRNTGWQQITCSLSSFVEEQWDGGADMDRADVAKFTLKFNGGADNQVCKVYVDDIKLLGQAPTGTLSGTIVDTDKKPVAGAYVFATDQTSLKNTLTDANGAYKFEGLSVGTKYHVVAAKDGFVFDPDAVTITLAEKSVQDVTASITPYNSLEKETLTDQFDESGLNPKIAYRGSREWTDGEAGDTRPVIDVTVDKELTVHFPSAADSIAPMYAIPQNTQKGATSPKYAVEIGGYYSWDMLAFGRDTDANYYVEADAYCDIRSDLTGFDRVSVGLHCSFYNPAMPALDALGQENNYHNSGGYALSYETDKGVISAVKYAPDNDEGRTFNRKEGSVTTFGEGVTLTEAGWHRFRVEYLDGKVTFTVDGKKLAETTDNAEYPFGPAGLHYRNGFGAVTDMNHARFDNLKAGPTKVVVSVNDWMLN